MRVLAVNVKYGKKSKSSASTNSLSSRFRNGSSFGIVKLPETILML